MHKQKYKQQGIALISVLIIVALISAVVSLMWAGQHQNFEHTEYTQTQAQMLQHLYSAESVAITLLIKDENKNVDYLYRHDELKQNTEHWNQKNLIFPISGGNISIKIEDLQAKLSINNIINITNLSTPRLNLDFSPILGCLNTRLQQVRMPVFILNYISDLGAKFNFSHLSELKQILKNNGFEDKDYYNIKTNLNALPKGVKININTAGDAILSCLYADLNVSELRNLMPFSNYSAALSALAHASSLSTEEMGHFISKKLISVKSEYFLLTTNINVNKISLTGQTIFRRKGDKIATISRNYY